MNILLVLIPVVQIILAAIILKRTISPTIRNCAIFTVILAIVVTLHGLDYIPVFEIEI